MSQPVRLDPRIAYNVDGRTLLFLLPHVDQMDLHEIRSEFARAIQAMRAPAATWQDAWNAWTGATPHSPGQITYTRIRCKICRGRRYNTRNIARNLSRTGSPIVCGECNGSGRGGRVHQSTRYAPTPPAGGTVTTDPTTNAETS